MKKIFYYLLIFILISLITVVTLFDTIAKNIAETYAQKSLGTPVSVAEFRSDWGQAQVNIDFIEVANPANFSNKNAFVLNHLTASLSEQTHDELVVLEQLDFDGLLFTLEQNDGQVNLVEILKQLNRQPKVANQKPSIEHSSAHESNHEESYRVKINQLKFVNTQLFVDTKWFKETIIVPNVIINNFGGQNGIPLAKIGSEIMKVALTRIQAEVEKKGLKLSEQEIKESARRQLQGKLNTLTNDLDGKAKNWLKKLGL
ncbi:hypothetical protein OAM64_01145 [Candidatus Thioglobus sp.]|nr:hypothetical protein [Candidatus Thioglobus sp.]